MLDREYGYNDPRLLLVQLKRRMKILTGALVDLGVHLHNMKKEEGLKILTGDAMFQPDEAEKIWLKACTHPAALTAPFIGLTALEQIRSEFEKGEGENFNLKAFHTKLLKEGPIAAKYMKSALGAANPPAPAETPGKQDKPVSP